MATDSSTLGFLAPVSQDVYDDALDDILQAAVVGITGIAGPLVRPRWQPEPTTQPPFTTDWCALGIVRRTPDVFAYVEHDGDLGTGGRSVVERDEELAVLHSFYGPNSSRLCERFRAGLTISQNRDTLRAAGLVLKEVEEAVILPALLKEKWVKRVDVTVTYRRRTQTVYEVLTIESAHFILNAVQ